LKAHDDVYILRLLGDGGDVSHEQVLGPCSAGIGDEALGAELRSKIEAPAKLVLRPFGAHVDMGRKDGTSDPGRAHSMLHRLRIARDKSIFTHGAVAGDECWLDERGARFLDARAGSCKIVSVECKGRNRN